ncbi:hypothetical protein TVAG_029210 [Trichomonas vaginalis G3]|uniref:Uncharacterized protein n=1 Tax=Trichomonas vaginalis (strain ATCC PRA-98 / G3) TaxID=412133 RepID=A2F513_TRIV3|nr:hypothetical protein TVAGG3_0594690 [Trichomonas vaginalis G3]EAY00017.1 hypothetical protein TVAG_029210 [Trichomonas vaginalis G3]KAI5523518.1 hypothetical protein TVAGG3_0594690 [Trichomonas vaginalis G3]|eukprot:XP_001312946.1 hypothetical protein [Trichomonas vaginalis G3]
MDYKETDLQKERDPTMAINLGKDDEERQHKEAILEKYPIGLNYVTSNNFDTVAKGIDIIYDSIRFDDSINLPEEIFEVVSNYALLFLNIDELKATHPEYSDQTINTVIVKSTIIVANHFKDDSKLQFLMSNGFFIRFITAQMTNYYFFLLIKFISFHKEFMAFVLHETNIFDRIIDTFQKFDLKNESTWKNIDFLSIFVFCQNFIQIYMENQDDIEFPLNIDQIIQIILTSTRILRFFDAKTLSNAIKFYVVASTNHELLAAMINEKIILSIQRIFEISVYLPTCNNIIRNILQILLSISDFSDLNQYLLTDEVQIWNFLFAIEEQIDDTTIHAYIAELESRLIFLDPKTAFYDRIENIVEHLPYKYKEEWYLKLLETIFHCNDEIFKAILSNSGFLFKILTLYPDQNNDREKLLTYLELCLGMKINLFSVPLNDARYSEFINNEDEFADWIIELYDNYQDVLNSLNDEFREPAEYVTSYLDELIQHFNDK